MSKSTSANKATIAPLTHSLAPGMRPERGAALFAHTCVFLVASGMMSETLTPGKAVPGALAREVLGERAIKWHLGRGNLERTSAGIVLTEVGAMHFAIRGADPELVDAYAAILTRGEPSSVAIPAVKKAEFIHPLNKA